ncbi:MAG TPA: L-2-hydroxyglutarate oxidase [Ignavibacteria bacterium]|nr:L-2-hydroxyglutarate oxidase [Ignavibacteria bacterium]HMQ98721.1 L-2-hydroxyglutarate oxidase [Ignavibacteria bacterium]
MSQSDVIIAGAGIVGLATALKILESKPGTKILILEKESGEARHQTGNNSGVIHSGIYYRPGSLKAQNCKTGYNQLLDFCNRHDIKFDICGKVIVATSGTELPRLANIYERGIANGLVNIRFIEKDELKELEPHAFGIKAIHVPYTGIIDYKEVSRKYAYLIREAGGEIRFNEKVVKINNSGSSIEVSTQNSSFNSKIFINCCGLQSDEVAGLSEKRLDTRIIPFRGEYYKIKPERRYLVRNLIYPVPDPAFPFLGVHFTRMTNGEVEAGPNAVLSFKKEGYKKTSLSVKDSFRTFTWKGFYSIASKYYKTGFGEFRRSFSKKAFVKALQKLMPEITAQDLVPGGAGVRAQAISIEGKLIDDFLIHDSGRIVNVLNAPSPAATSSLAIGQAIAEKIVNKL